MYSLFPIPEKENATSASIPPTPPKEELTAQEADTLLAKDMAQLSVAERDQALNEIHGVADEADENPESIVRALVQFEEALQHIPQREAYELAKSMSVDYVSSRKLLLMFLRADRFDVKKAALRIVRFFEYKLELFGPDLLTKDIKMDDLNEDDLDCLWSPFSQTLPQRDSSGRGISILMPKVTPDKPVISRLRRIFYTGMVVAEDEEIQKKGLTVVVYLLGVKKKLDRQAAWRVASLTATALPFRFESIHICYDNPLLVPFFAVGMLSAGSFYRVRARIHYGSHWECLYKLMGFGIPRQVLPFTDAGEMLPPDAYKAFWEKRRNFERSQNAVSRTTIVVPGSFDVLLGRGHAIQNNKGNVLYREVIKEMMDEYTEGRKLEKTALTKTIVDLIHASTGRFLEKNGNNCWVEADETTARKKVSHSFRTLRRLDVRASEPKCVKAKGSDDSDGATSDSSPGSHIRGRSYGDSYAGSETSQDFNLTFNGTQIDNHIAKRARI